MKRCQLPLHSNPKKKFIENKNVTPSSVVIGTTSQLVGSAMRTKMDLKNFKKIKTAITKIFGIIWMYLDFYPTLYSCSNSYEYW